MSRCLLPVAILAAMTAIACADPPSKEIEQAEAAIEAARAAGADHYAGDELTGAREALKQAHEAVADRDYRLALNHALQARERARSAATEAADRKAAARSEAERAVAGVARALEETRARLRGAETARAPARTLSNARYAVTSAEEALQKARTAIAAGDYSAAVSTTNGTAQHLRAVSRELEAAAPPPARRRR
jgi:hypothetical protein